MTLITGWRVRAGMLRQASREVRRLVDCALSHYSYTVIPSMLLLLDVEAARDERGRGNSVRRSSRAAFRERSIPRFRLSDD